jgi:hypothetical protein
MCFICSALLAVQSSRGTVKWELSEFDDAMVSMVQLLL